MTATALDPKSTGLSSGSTPRGRVTFGHVMKSEWIKLRTLRSSWFTLAAAIGGMVAIGLVVGFATASSNWAHLDVEDTVASAPLQGYLLAELFIGVLGVLFVTGEYGTGMIRSTFAAVPKRLPVLGAKSMVFGSLALLAMIATSFATFFAAQIILSADGHGSSLSDPGALRAVVGVGIYLAMVGLLGGAIGWIIRSTAGAISALFGLLLIVPVLFQLMPGKLSTEIAEFLPSTAGGSIASSFHQPDTLAPWTGLGVFALWVAAAMVAAVLAVRRRDT